MEHVIAITADLQSGDDGLARAFHGLALAAKAWQHGDHAEVAFVVSGTRWPAAASRIGHPLHGVRNAVRAPVEGASCGCADVVEACGVPKWENHAPAGTSGLAGRRCHSTGGWPTLVL